MPRVFAVLAIVMTGCSGGVNTGTPQDVGIARQHIVDGVETVDSNTVLLQREGRPFCSGILISPRVVLTAAHCLPPFAGEHGSEIRVIQRDGWESQGFRSVVHPDWGGEGDVNNDIGLLETVGISFQTWVSVPHRPFKSLPGYGVALGYGVTDPDASDYGVQRGGISNVVEYDDTSIQLDDGATTCFGDSGGPLLVYQDGIEVVMGIHSHSTCDGRFQDTRVDAHFESLIRPFLNEIEGDPCVADDFCLSSWFCSDGSEDPDCDEGQCEEDGYCDQSCFPDRDCLCGNGQCDDDSGCSAVRHGQRAWLVGLAFVALLLRRRRARLAPS